jgi:antitoxin VapB
MERRVKLFKNGRNQAVRIPREFELPGGEAIIRKEGQRLIVEPAPPKSLLAILAILQTLDEEFPPIDIPRQSRLTCDGAVSARHQYLVGFDATPTRPNSRSHQTSRERRVCTTIIVATELRYGAAKKGTSRLKKQLETVLNAVDVLALERTADTLYGESRASRPDHRRIAVLVPTHRHADLAGEVISRVTAPRRQSAA